MDDETGKALDLVDEALALPAQDRVAFIDARTAHSPALRERVLSLLARAETADNSLGHFLPTGGGIRAFPGLEDRGADLTGRVLGRYNLVREIGRGGMGVVYEARDDQLQRTVAVKVLNVQHIDARTRERFLREARSAAALNHPAIVAIFDAGEADGLPFLVMEFVPGQSLDRQPPRSLDQGLEIARQVCAALDHAHGRGLVHRDLKPGNILVTFDGDRIIAKLTDMGIALARGQARVTGTGVIAGTPTHMAPEQALGQPVDARADLYSLGVMLYTWAAGRPPFAGDDALAVVSQHIHAPVVPPRTYRPDLPAGLEPLILKLLAKSPERRPATAGEVRSALDAVGTGLADAITQPGIAIDGLTRGRLVGRRQELEGLQQLWRLAAAGRSHMALISGEPGVGKTRLAFEVMATAQLDGALALSGGCYENEATTPYLPFLEAFRRIVRERDDAALRETLGDTAAELARLAPEIESRLGPFPERSRLGAQEERLRLFDHVARFLRRLATGRGLLFFIDDLQWADHGSLALLHYLMRQLSADRVLFLATYREVELDRAHPLSKTLVDWNRERLATRLRLERLGNDDTGLMISTLLGQQDVSAEFVLSLHRETEGNPFFVEEIVKALIADGGLVREGSAWRRVTDEFVLPQSVKSAIGSRLARVSEPTSEVLRAAAVLGKLFDFAELTAVADQTEDQVLDALDEATATQLITPGSGESFAFTHDKIREVLYDELNPIRRRRIHARVARGLESLLQSGEQVTVEDLAYHFIQAGDLAGGLKYSRLAAESARRVFAYDEAVAMLSRARECAVSAGDIDEVVRIDRELGDVAYERGDIALAAEHYERGLADVRDADTRNALRCLAGRAYVTGGDPRGLAHVLAALEELVEPGESGTVRSGNALHPRWTAEALNVRARYAHVAGELKTAVDIYRRAIELARPLAEPSLLISLYSNLAGSLQHLGEFEESDRVSGLCLEIGKRQNLPLGEMLAWEFMSENAIYRGFWTRSVEAGESEEAIAESVHAGGNLAWSRFRAFALHALGRLAEAEELFRQSIEATLRSGERRLGLFMLMGLADLRLSAGHAGEALAELTTAVAEADRLDLLSHRIVGRGHLSKALLDLERWAEAAAAARVAIGLWRASDSQGVFLIHGACFAEALLRGGDTESAVEILDAHEDFAKRTLAEHRLAQNLRSRAVLLLQQGREDEARSALETACAKFAACGSVIEHARTLKQLER